MQVKSKLINSNESWNAKRRYKINAVVTHNGSTWQNATGINSEPGATTDWILLKTSSVIIYDNDFVDSGTHSFTVPSGIYIQNAFLNGAQVVPFTQTGTIVTVPSAITDDLVKLTGRN